MAHLPVAGPLGERDLGDQLRPDPVRDPAERAGRARRERRVGALQAIQARAQRARRRLREAGADLPGEAQRAALVEAHQQRPDPLAAALGVGEAADHQLLAGEALRLGPGGVPPGPVGRVGALRDDPLQAEAARLPEHLGARRVHVRRVPEHLAARAEQAAQRVLALEQRPPGEVLAVEPEQVEDEVGERAAPAGERLLERLEAGPAAGQHRGHLAVEQRAPRRQRLGGARHLGELRGPVVAAPAPQRGAPALQRAADPVAVVLRLVHPALARRRRRHERRELGAVRRDGRAGHVLKLTTPGAPGQAAPPAGAGRAGGPASGERRRRRGAVSRPAGCT
ncbi:hypothetical protein PSR1_04516 [Anaeromyxobacter sp. PSR-1]|nr:hypothetical protein PSR1_04516 [Anaeromyxobacter sp. PSR-1]